MIVVFIVNAIFIHRCISYANYIASIVEPIPSPKKYTVTGNFDEEEAAKLVTDLTPPQLFNLHTWIEFYENEEKYPFVGLLEGNLYDKDGMPTAMMKEVQAMIDEGRASNEEFQRKKQERRDRRMREDAEKKKREEDSKLKQQESQILTPSKSRDSREALLLETKVTEEL